MPAPEPHPTMIAFLERLESKADLTVYLLDPTAYVFFLGMADVVIGAIARPERAWIVERHPGFEEDVWRQVSYRGLVRMVFGKAALNGGADSRLPLPPHIRIPLGLRLESLEIKVGDEVVLVDGTLRRAALLDLA